MPNKRIDPNEKKVPIGADIKQKYKDRLKELAKLNNISYTAYIERIIVQHLKSLKSKDGK